MSILSIAVAVAVTFAGCVILLVDVVITKRTDLCQDETPALCVGGAEGARPVGKPGLFVLAAPEFRYEYEGEAYEGRSANVFFHVFLGSGRLAVPFREGKTYLVYVNPAQPSMYVTAGEQRFAFMHVLGCAVSAAGVLLLLGAMGVFG